MSTLLSQAPFSDRFVARIDSGLFSERPANPDGTGHAYFASDTDQLFIGEGTSTWTEIGGGAGSSAAVLAQASRAGTFSVSASSYTPIQFDTEDIDTDAIWDVSNASRFTIPAGKGGKWRLYFQFDADFSATPASATITQMKFRKGGSTDLTDDLDVVVPLDEQRNEYHVFGNFSAIVSLAAGEYVEVLAYHNDTGHTLRFKGWMSAEFLGT